MPSIQTLLDSPALVPPGGVKPNFVNPPNLNTVFYVTILSCLVLPTVVLAVRLYTKACIIRKVVLEDCTSPSSV